MPLRALAIVAALLLGSSSAYSQCSGNPAAGLICGNSTAGPTLPGWKSLSSLIDRNFGAPSAQGTILNRGATLWGATASPSLGVNGGNSGALVLNGSSTGSATIGVKAAAGNTTFNLPVGNGALNNVLITDGVGNTSWAAAGGGTVSSVGLALPSIFTVSGSPVTTTGTLTGTLATQSANLVWAGPTTGAASAPTFRSLVGADLPNPAPTTLGGVQSFAAVSSQWIRQISTLGVPTASQPAFSDISGSLSPTQCPNPSATTIGCAESYAAVSHQWINTISTLGVPSSTQPNFTDLAGSATLAQLPSISNNSVLGNNSGGTAVPSTLSASNVLDFIATTQGDVLYRNASIWTALPPGTNGQVLTSGGAAANPSWTTVTGTGTVTSVATNNGLTGGPITTTGTIGLATITAGSVMANITGGSAIPIANTPSSILDLIGSTPGDILYRTSGSGWAVLPPGSNGQVLTQGASTPSWANAGTLTNVTVVAGSGIAVSGTCNISTTGSCTVAESLGSSTVTGASTTFTSGQCFVNVSRSNSGAAMADTLPGTSPGVLPAGCVVTVTNVDTAGVQSIKVGAGAAFKTAVASTGYAYLCPGQSSSFLSDGANYSATRQPLRCKLQASTTLFAATTGSSTNDGLTSSTPLPTITATYALAQTAFDINFQPVTFKAATGTYAAVLINGPLIGASANPTQGSNVSFIGDTTTPTNVVIATTTANNSWLMDGAVGLVSGFSFTNTIGHNFQADLNSIALLGKINYGGNGSGQNMVIAADGSVVFLVDNQTATAGGPNPGCTYIAAAGGSIQTFNTGATITFTASGTFNWVNAFACTQYYSTIIINTPITFSVTSASGHRYSASSGSTINSNSGGANFFPGSIAGTTGAFGTYQ